MRIGIDIKCLRSRITGIERLVLNILNTLQRIDDKNEYILFTPSPVEYKPTHSKWKVAVVPSRLPGILWQQFVLPKALKKEKIDVIWGPEQTIPTFGLGNTASILTIHDFVYRRYPETMRKSVLWINRTFGRRSVVKASKIACVSEFTQTELFHFFPQIDIKKVNVVHSAMGHYITQDSISGANAVPRKKQLLFVGSLEPRKNLAALIHALEILQNRGISIPLIMTGPSGWRNQTIKDLLKNSCAAPNIHHMGFVSDEQLIHLYQESAAVIFPSVYEGFGLPALEPLSFRTPVLTSKGSVMETLIGECGIYLDPFSAESMADSLEKFWNNGNPLPFPTELEQKRIEILKKFTWENSSMGMLKIFNEFAHD